MKMERVFFLLRNEKSYLLPKTLENTGNRPVSSTFAEKNIDVYPDLC